VARKKISRLQELVDQGFDNSEVVPFKGTWKVRCSKCLAAVINNMPTHETGCPNIPKPKRDEDDEEDLAGH
jgi:hypothetical protein